MSKEAEKDLNKLYYMPAQADRFVAIYHVSYYAMRSTTLWKMVVWWPLANYCGRPNILGSVLSKMCKPSATGFFLLHSKNDCCSKGDC